MKYALQLSSVVLILLIQSAFADVAILKFAGAAHFDEVRNGFSSICFEKNKEFILLDDLSNQNEIAAEIKGGTYNLIVAVGSRAAAHAKSNFPGLPIIFCLVMNSEVNSLKGDNITGVSLDLRIKDQLAVMKNISKKIKRVGVIYTQPFNDPLISSLRDSASTQNLSVVTATVSGGQDIQRAMTEVIDKIDALWIPPDPSLSSDEVIRYIGATSLSKQIPCFGPNERYVRSGAIFSMAFDGVEAGRLAGDLANKIIQGTSPSRLSVVEMQKLKIIINTRAAGLIGVTIPRNIQDAANKVYQ